MKALPCHRRQPVGPEMVPKAVVLEIWNARVESRADQAPTLTLAKRPREFHDVVVRIGIAEGLFTAWKRSWPSMNMTARFLEGSGGIPAS